MKYLSAIEVSADNIFGNGLIPSFFNWVIQKSSSGLDEPITNTKLPGSQNTLIMFNITVSNPRPLDKYFIIK